MGAAKRKVKRLADTYARCPDAGEGEEQTLMALVTTEKMLKDAQAGHYAVGAFNVENLEFVMAVLAAAEETKSPVIMQTTPGTIKTAGLDYFYGMVKAAAERASVPVALHLDHGDGYDRCMQAFRTGYTSVMIDGSHESFEDNIALTKSVADAGRAMGVPVEAELGKVGGKEDDGPAVEGESPYTDPAEAKEFVERTGCTSLAIGVGTSHGVYTSDPHIEQSVVKAIRDAVDVPLVLHGTSGVPDEQVAEAEAKAEEESSVFVYDAKALGSNKTTFTELMMSGEYVILLVDRAQYDNILDSGAIVPLADLFDADKIPDCAYDDSSIVFSETPFAQFFNATDVLPEDTLLCVLQASENSIFKGKDKAETQYRQQLMLYKKMINFSKGKSR